MTAGHADLLVDTHVHVWDPGALRYPWLELETTLNQALLPPTIDRAAGPTGMIFVEAGTEPAHASLEVEWVLQQDWPELAGIIAAIQLDGDPPLALLDLYQNTPRVVGVRHLLQHLRAGSLTTPQMALGLAAVAECDLTFDATIRADQLRELVELHELAPHAFIILDHLGNPPYHSGLDSVGGQRWLDDITALAQQTDVAVKISGTAVGSRTLPFIDAAVAAFTPERVMLGSDFPVTPTTPWDTVPDLLKLDAEERQTMRWRTAARVYKIDPAPGS